MGTVPRQTETTIEFAGGAVVAANGNYPNEIPVHLWDAANLKAPSTLQGAPRGRLTAVRLFYLATGSAAVLTDIRVKIVVEHGQSTGDERYLVYDTGVLTDGVDGIDLAEDDLEAFWSDVLENPTTFDGQLRFEVSLNSTAGAGFLVIMADLEEEVGL